MGHPGSGGDRCRARAHSSSCYRRTNRRTLRKWRVDIRHRTVTSSGQRLRSTPRRGLETTQSLFDSIRLGRSSASGASASARNASPGSRNDLAAGDRPAFPPSVVVAVKALACELPYEHELPLSRWSIPEIKREVLKRGLVASVGDTTLWRWLTEDAIRPWAQRTWIFPRAPDFEQKAGRVLDLYEGLWLWRRPRSDPLSAVSEIQLQRGNAFVGPPEVRFSSRESGPPAARRMLWGWISRPPPGGSL